MNKQLFAANDKELFDLTGCLSMCEKYAYSAQQEGATTYTENGDYLGTNPDTTNNTLMLGLYYSNVEHELREQVNMSKYVTQQILVHLISVHHI